MTAGYFFATPWPRQAAWFAAQRLLRWINNFAIFYVTHMIMAVSVVVLLIIHPYPGPPVDRPKGRSNTWVYMAGGLLIYLVGTCLQAFR